MLLFLVAVIAFLLLYIVFPKVATGLVFLAGALLVFGALYLLLDDEFWFMMWWMLGFCIVLIVLSEVFGWNDKEKKSKTNEIDRLLAEERMRQIDRALDQIEEEERQGEVEEKKQPKD